MVDDIQKLEADQKEANLNASKNLENISKITKLNAELETDDKLTKQGKVSDNKYWRNLDRDIKIQKEQSDEKSNQSYQQNEETITLDAKQAREKLLNSRDKSEVEIRNNASLDIALGKAKSPLEVLANINQLNTQTNFDLNNTLPLNERQARESNALNLKHALENNQLAELQSYKKMNKYYDDAMADIARNKELNAQQQKYFRDLVLANTDANFQAGYNLTGKDEFDNNVSVTDSYSIPASLLRGVTELADGSLTLLASLPTILTRGEFQVNQVHLTKKILNRIGWHSVSENDVNSDMEIFDKLSLGLVVDTIATSIPEMLALIGSGGILAAGRTAGKAAILKATKEKTLARLGNLKDRALAAGKRTEANAINQSIALVNALDDKFFISKKAFGEVLGATAGVYKNVPINAFSKASLGTALKSYGKYMSLGTGLYIGDVARRTFDLASERGDGAKVTLNDLLGAVVHSAVDWGGAAIVGNIGSKTIFGKELFEGGLKDTLKGVASGSRLDTLMGLGKLGGKGAGIAGIEGIGESIQTYFELQAASNYTLPDLATILLNRDGQYDDAKRAITEAGVLGGLAGIGMNVGITGIQSVFGGYSDLKKSLKTEDKEPTDGSDNTTTDQTKEITNKSLELLQTATEKAMKAVKGKDANESDIKAEATERINKIKTLKEETKKETEELNKELAQQGIKEQVDNKPARYDNSAKIQQLEYIKSKLDESSESVKRIDELIKKYKDLDNISKASYESIMMTDLSQNESNISDKSKFNQAMQKLISFKPEEHEDSTKALREIEQELVDSINFTTNEFRSLKKLLDTKENKATVRVADESAIDAQTDTAKSKKEEKTDKQDSDTIQESKDDNKPTSEQQGEQLAQDESKDTTEAVKDDSEVKNDTDEAIRFDIDTIAEADLTQKDINGLFRTLSPDVALFVLAKSLEEQRMSNPSAFGTEFNEGFKHFIDNFDIVRIPYENIEGTREDSATTIKQDNNKVFAFNDKEILLVSKHFYDTGRQEIRSIKKDKDITNPIQEALTALNKINSETYKEVIAEIENLIENITFDSNGNINQKDIDKINEKIEELSAKFQIDVRSVGKHIILLNAITAANPSSPLAKQVRLNASIAAKTLESIKKEMFRLNDRLNGKKIDDIKSNELSSILDDIRESTLSVFSSLKTKIREYRSLDSTKEGSEFKTKQNSLFNEIKLALKTFQRIAEKLVSVFNNQEFAQTYENVLTLLTEGNTALFVNLVNNGQTEMTLNIGGDIKKISFSAMPELANTYFYDILYNTFNLREYGIDSKMVVLDKLLAQLFTKEGINQQVLDTLNYLSEDFKDIKINLPITISNNEQISIGRAASETTKTISISLNELLNLDDRILEEMYSHEIQEGQTFEDARGQLKTKLRNMLADEKSEIRKEIINRFSVQLRINESIGDKLDTLLKIGLLTQAYTAIKSTANDDNNKAIKLDNDKDYAPRNVSNFRATQMAFIKTLLGESNEAGINSNTAVDALLSISVLLANAYMESKQMNNMPLIDDTHKINGKSVLGINRALIAKLEIQNKDLFDNWINITSNQNQVFNNVKDLLVAFEKFAKRVGIRESARKAMMYNLQQVGKIHYKQGITEKIFKNIIGENLDKVYDEIKFALSKNDKYTINAEEYNRRKYDFLNTLSKDKALAKRYQDAIRNIQKGKIISIEEDILLKQCPLSYIPIPVKTYDSNGNLIEDKRVYVYSPALSILNEKVSNQILSTNSDVIALESIFEIGDINSLNELYGTIEGRLQTFGEGIFKIFNGYENSEGFDTKYFNDKIDYSKAVYYLSDLLPNGRTANQIANTEQDNKLLREITVYHQPQEIFYYDYKEKDPTKRLKKRPNTDALQWSGVDKSTIKADEVSHNGKYKDHYYGLLYSLAMAFGVDFDKIKLRNPQDQDKFDKAIKKLNNLHNILFKSEKAINDIQKTKDVKKLQQIAKDNGIKYNKDTNVMIAALDTKINDTKTKINTEYKNLVQQFPIDYMYKNESLMDLLDGLLRDDQAAKDKFKQLWAKREQESINVFTEHPGISIKNGNIFLEAIDSGNFIQNIQTQDLVVYADGKATFSAQNSVRMKGIYEIDALSGISRNITQSKYNIPFAFIRERAILNKIKERVKKFANNNKNFNNYLDILEKKGADAYTVAIGPTTLTMRGLRGTNNLLTSLYSEELLDRDLIKKPTQAPSYGQEVSSVLESYIESIKVPFNRMLFRLFNDTNFLNKTLPSNITVQDALVKINNDLKKNNINLITEESKRYMHEIAHELMSTMNDRIESLKKKFKPTPFEEIEVKLLEGLYNNLQSNPTNQFNMLYYSGILTNFTQNGNKEIDFTALSKYFFNDETDKYGNKKGLLFKDKERINKYYNNFDFTNTDTPINSDMLHYADNVINAISNNADAKYFFKNMKEEWFKNLNEVNGVYKNNYLEIRMIPDDKGAGAKIEITILKTLNDEINNIMSTKTLDGKTKNEIIANTYLYYATSNGSFLPNHKPLSLRANPTLSIVKQNNEYIKEQRNLIENRLIELFDTAMNKIIAEAENLLKYNNIKEDVQTAYRNNTPVKIIGSDGKVVKIIGMRDHINNQKRMVINRFVNSVYRNFWVNRDLYIQIFKQHPNLNDKTNFSQLINKTTNELDNRLSTLLTEKLPLGSNSSYSSLITTKTIMSDVIGQFNHPFEALLIVEMNNPTTQVFDAYIGNANNIVRFMNTWNETLASESGANVDSAVILDNFYKSLQKSMDNALENVGLSKTDTQTIQIDNLIKDLNDTNKDKLKDILRFKLNLLRHLIQLSTTDRILANNAVGIHNIFDITDASGQYNKKIRELRNECLKDIVEIFNKLEEDNNPAKIAFLNELRNREDYNILGEKDINLNNKAFNPTKDLDGNKVKNKVSELEKDNRSNITSKTRNLFNDTLNIKLKYSNAITDIVGKIVKYFLKRTAFGKNHNDMFINAKTNIIDISDIFDVDKISIKDIDKIVNANNVATIQNKLKSMFSDKETYSISEIVDAVLTEQIINSRQFKSALNSADSDANAEIINNIKYSDLIIECNKANISTATIELNGKTPKKVMIDMSQYESQELQLLEQYFNAFKSSFSNEIKSIENNILNNSITGSRSFIIYDTSLSSSQDSLNRLTSARASRRAYTIPNVGQKVVLMYDDNTSNIYYNMIIGNNSKTHQTITQNIQNAKNKNNNITNSISGQPITTPQPATPAAQQQANNATVQQATQSTQTTQANQASATAQNANANQSTNTTTGQSSAQTANTNTNTNTNTKPTSFDSDYVLQDNDTIDGTFGNGEEVEQSIQDYQRDMNRDLDSMKKDNQDIAEEITMVASLINGLVANFKKGIKFFKNSSGSRARGSFSPKNNKITIYAGANRGTRAHEFIHAGLTFAFDNVSNETAYLISQISNLHNEVRAYIESIPEKDRAKFIREIFGDSPNPLARYDYVFGQSTDHNLQEFVSVFLTSPRLIRFLASKEFSEHLTRIPEFKVEAKTRLGKAIKYIPILIGYTFKLIMSRFKEQNRNGLNILTTAVAGLSKYNTEEGQLSEQEAYDRRMVTRTNKAVRSAVLTITKNVEHYINKMKALDPNYNADREVAEIKQELDEKVKSIANDVREIRALNQIANLRKTGRFVRNIRTGIWLIQSIYYSRLGLRKLMENPIKAQIVANVMQELRQAAVEGTLLDTRIQMDFGISTTKFLKNFVNSVNRALGFRTELDMQKEVAASNISKQVGIILGKPKYIAERIANDTKDKKFYKAYSEGANKIIVHQNLGDYFFGDEMVNQDDLNTLVDFAMVDNEETNQRIIETRNAKVASAIRALGFEENSDHHKAIAKIVDSMGITRVTDKKNSLGSQNIEQMLRELGVDFKNSNIKSALKELHQAITLSAILAPRIYNRADFEYIKDKTHTFRSVYANPNLKNKDRAEIRESIKELITLHKSKLDGLYKQKQLKFKDKGVQALINKTKLDDMYYTDMSEMYEEVSAFEYMTDAAYYSDSYKPSEYNQSVTIVNLDPTSENFQEQKDALLKKGFKMENRSQLTGIETFKYDGLINLNNGKDRRGFMYRANTHKGNVIQYLSEEDVNEMKVEAREKYKQNRPNQILNYGKDYTFDGHYIFDSKEFYELGDTKSFAGSETMTRDNISVKQLEEWTGMDTSIESAFRSMERTIQDNIVRNMNNNLIWQQVLLANEEIERRESEGVNHHSEVLFRIGADENGEVRVTFNHSLKEFYGFELTRQDEADFAKFYKAMNNGNLPVNSTIKIDSRMVGMLFGYDLPTFTKSVENDPIKFKIGRAIESATRFLVKESRNNTIIRNPALVWENLKSNIIGLVGEGVPFTEIMKVFPYYVNQLNKYHKDMKDKVRIANEIVIKEKQEYRDKAGITADQQKREVDKLKRQLEIIDEDLKKNAVAPLMGQGLYTNIVEDAETQGFKWDQKLLELVDKTDKLSKEQIAYLNELFMTESSDAYQTLAYLTRIGDFIPRVILYHHIMGKGREKINGKLETKEQTHRRALDEARDRFINYNTPMWSPVLRKLDRFGFTNYAKYAFSVEKQIAKVFVKAPVQATTIVGMQLGLDAMGVSSVLKPSAYLTESFIFDHKLPSGFINPFTPTDTFVDSLNRWNYVTPNLNF